MTVPGKRPTKYFSLLLSIYNDIILLFGIVHILSIRIENVYGYKLRFSLMIFSRFIFPMLGIYISVSEWLSTSYWSVRDLLNSRDMIIPSKFDVVSLKLIRIIKIIIKNNDTNHRKMEIIIWVITWCSSVGFYLFKVNNGNTRIMKCVKSVWS